MADTETRDTGTTWVRQFSLRWVLALTAACAVVSLLTASSVRGSHWAFGVVVALVALLLVIVVHAMVFGSVWLLAAVLNRLRGRGGGLDADHRSVGAARGTQRRAT